MKPRRFVLATLAASMLLLAPSPAFANESSVETYLEEWKDLNNAPGIAAAVFDGSTASTWFLGEDGSGTPMTADTPFLIGSVAKTCTSTMVLQLVEEGEISLDDPISTHLPWIDHDATVRQLLDHTAGYTAANGLSVSERYREDLTPTNVAQQLDHSGDIGHYTYSSANYLVLGALIEAASGRGFEEELSQRITAPAEMTSTTIDGPDTATPPGHRLWWGYPVSYSPGHEPSGAPYGYLVSTLEDLVAYADAQLNATLLTPELQEQAWEKQSATDSAQGYGFGWRIDNSGDVKRVHHTGATPGYFTHLMLMPESRRAVIVMATSYSESTAPSLAAAAADIDRLSQGGESASPTPADPALTALPWLTLIPAALAAITFIGVLIRQPRSTVGFTLLLAVSVVIAALLALAPTLMGMSWHVIKTWSPDILTGLISGIVLWIGVTGFLILRRRTHHSHRDNAPDKRPI